MKDSKISWTCTQCGSRYEDVMIKEEHVPLFDFNGKLVKIEPKCEACNHLAYINQKDGVWQDFNS